MTMGNEVVEDLMTDEELKAIDAEVAREEAKEEKKTTKEQKSIYELLEEEIMNLDIYSIYNF